MISLLSDFGLSDAYVAQMKAVLLSISPDVEIVDISHEVEKHNILEGSYLLETTAQFFPAGSIHIAVVDPGVGGPRLPIIIACDQGTLIGPDNGLLARASDRLGLQAAYRIENRDFMRDNVSSTFHGRDVFAFAGAKLAQGARADQAGSKLTSVVQLDLPPPHFSKNRLECRVLYLDSFGNVVTNVSEADFGRLRLRDDMPFKVLQSDKETIEGISVRSYFEIPKGKLGLLLGSQGYLELALCGSRASKKLRVKVLDRLEIEFS